MKTLSDFIMSNYPWGKLGTILEKETYLEKWHQEAYNIIDNRKNNEPLRLAIAAGHGVGLTCFCSWLIQWFVSQYYDAQVVITANTYNQLSQITWKQLEKWHKLSYDRDNFLWTKTKYALKENPHTRCAYPIPWNDKTPESFAGFMSDNILIIFDECSNIPKPIWDVIESNMNNPNAIWIVMGKPLCYKKTDMFRQCFESDQWIKMHVNSEDTKIVSKEFIQQIIEEYGEDSDFARMRIKGQFPKLTEEISHGNCNGKETIA